MHCGRVARSALLGASLALPAGLAQANVIVTILDTTLVLQQQEFGGGSQGDWTDVVGPAGGAGAGNHGYNTHSLTVELDTTNMVVIVTARTNFPRPAQTVTSFPDYFMADIFFNLGQTGSLTDYTYAINTGYDYTANPNPLLPPVRSAVLASPSFQEASNPADPFWVSLDLFPEEDVAGWWSDTCSGAPAGPNCAPPPPTAEALLIPVEIKGTTVGGTTVTRVTNNANFDTVGYRREHIWTIAGLDEGLFSDFVDGFDILWGTANCGNDTIHGSYRPQQVAAPATLSLLIPGLVALRVLRRRRAA